MSTQPADEGADSANAFRGTLIRVLAVQVVTLAALWWLQARYGT